MICNSSQEISICFSLQHDKENIDKCLIILAVKQMNQANVFDLSPSMVRKGTNPDDRPSRVREVVQKFDMLSKSNGSSFSTPGQINPNESSSSSTDSTVSENGIEGQTSTPESATLPKRSHVSTATIDIRPPILPTRRVLPAIPLSVPESNHGMNEWIFDDLFYL